MCLYRWVPISNMSRQAKSQDEAANSQNRGTSPPWEDYANPGGRWWILPLTRRERTRCWRKIPGVTRSKIWALGSAAQKKFPGFRVWETSYALYEEKRVEVRRKTSLGVWLEVWTFAWVGQSFLIELNISRQVFCCSEVSLLRLFKSWLLRFMKV